MKKLLTKVGYFRKIAQSAQQQQKNKIHLNFYITWGI